ncbi:hypothetical protein [Burkholderia cepacia]|uniref:hypothetical protein n=1 Tax=Burkholderia cepacia TaxID=292 RepID=UPI002990667A|nr:hypothetical protein [Burkholderia cepacia]
MGSVSYAAVIFIGRQKCVALVVDNVQRAFLWSAALLKKLAEIGVIVFDFTSVEIESYQDPGVLDKVFSIREKLGIGTSQAGGSSRSTTLKF